MNANPREVLGEPRPGGRYPRLAGSRVLVVEDYVDTLNFMMFVLKRCGAEAVGVMSARGALEAFHDARFDALVSDIAMAGEDGLWLIQQVRHREPVAGGRVPAVAVTAHTAEFTRSYVLDHGFNGYLRKPFTSDQLCDIVERVLEDASRSGEAEP